jgi:hypothetical protein
VFLAFLQKKAGQLAEMQKKVGGESFRINALFLGITFADS